MTSNGACGRSPPETTVPVRAALLLEAEAELVLLVLPDWNVVLR